MEFLGYQYYKVYSSFLLSLGLWSNDSTCFKQIRIIFCILMFIFLIIAQLLKLFTMEYDLDFILADLSFAIPSLVYFLKYSTFYIQSHKIRQLMEYIRNDWNALQNEQEINIIRKYAVSAKRYMYAFVGVSYPGTIGFLLISLLPDILDIIVPLNESRTRHLPFMVEYFLNEQKYFYLLFLHIAVTVILGITTVIATEALMLAYVYHICGMFKVIRYRIERALNASTSISPMLRENMIHIKIIDAIEIHQRTIEFFEYLSSTFSLSYFILMVLGVISLSLNLFRLFQVAILPDQKKNLASFVIFVSGHFCYMFICNYLGQKITDNSTEIYNEVYNTQWYAAPIKTQKLLLFIMQRSIKSCKLVLGGIYYVSVENFTTLASMSLSYFTVLYSMQK
ncbi:hypothetical protein P5V15_004463 [Pogonomyrmex californicus]